MKENQVKHIFKGKIYKLRYKVNRPRFTIDFSNFEIHPILMWWHEEAGEETFKELLLEGLSLEMNEQFYFEDIQETVTISRKIKTDNDNIVYITDKIIKVIEDEETKNSLRRSEIELEKIEAQEKENLRLKAIEEERSPSYKFLEKIKKWISA